MFDTIVWATDGSESADRAFPVLQELAKEQGARVVVAHNKELMIGRAAGYPLHIDEPELLAKIRGQVKTLREQGIEARLELVTGSMHGPAHVLAEIAREHEADLIVTGTRGHSPLTGLVLGSVTQRLLHIAPCPVLAVPAVAVEIPAEPLEREEAAAT